MKVRMRTTYASPSGVCQPDEVIDLPAAEARRLISQGYAIVVDPDPESAMASPAGETAMRPRAKARG